MPLPPLSLQKMLMKQQDRLEEREQDIEDQLYKLESDKRLVEVAKPKFMVGVGAAWVQGLGLVLIWVRICVWSALCQNPLVSHSLNCQLLSPTGVAGTEPCATSRSNLALRNPGQSGGLGSQTLPSRMSDRQKRQPVVPRAHLPAHPCPLCLQEKVSQLKEEVRLQYEKLHQLLDEDLGQTVEVLDKAQAKFCSENAAQALHLGERMQEAKKLLGSLQLLFDKTEDVSFMKVGWAQDWWWDPGAFLKWSLQFFF